MGNFVVAQVFNAVEPIVEAPIMENSAVSRRVLIELLAAGGLLAAVPARTLAADSAPHVSPNDPVASALGYTEDATKVDTKASPNYQAGEKCANCLQNSGAAGATWGPCKVFAGKLVNENGWCRAYVRRS